MLSFSRKAARLHSPRPAEGVARDLTGAYPAKRGKASRTALEGSKVVFMLFLRIHAPTSPRLPKSSALRKSIPSPESATSPCRRWTSPKHPPLPLPLRLHAASDHSRRLPQPLIAQLPVIHTWNFDVNIGPVQVAGNSS